MVIFTGKALKSMDGMIRYILPVYFLLALIWTRDLDSKWLDRRSWRWHVSLAILHLAFLFRYLRGHFVS